MPQYATDSNGNGHIAECVNDSKLECGPMPNLMVALPNIGGALILPGHVEEVLLLNKFFPIVDTCLRCACILNSH